ncbi:MAG: hypothetical protein AB7C96_08485 [Hydrogenovibrio sp.]
MTMNQRTLTNTLPKRWFQPFRADTVSWRHLLLAFVLLFAQTAALLHAEIHPFHEHTEVCNAFDGVEHQASAFTPTFELPQTPVYRDVWRPDSILSFAATFAAVYFSRAPPAFS